MNIRLFLVVALLASPAASVGQTISEKPLFMVDAAFDARNVQTHHAEASPCSAGGGRGLDVVLSRHEEGATVRLLSSGWDLSGYAGVAMDITNHGRSAISVLGKVGIGKQKTSLQSFVRVEPAETETMFIVFMRGEPPQSIAKHLTGMRGFPGSHLMHWITPDLTKLNAIELAKARHDQQMHFTVTNIRATGAYRPPTEEDFASTFFPIVDQFGQYTHAQWPGKTLSQADIDAQREAESDDLAANPGPKDWNAYGGWLAGPQLRATGHFRTQKVDGRWWLVDPDGRLFWSVGITGVRLSQATKIWQREHYFAQAVPGGDFRAANLKRKFGDDWDSNAADQAHTRLRSWGINTMASWSDPALYGMKKTPYVVAMGSGVDKYMPDELDEASFRRNVRRRINAYRVADFKDDPWCLGVFVDNELRWPRRNTLQVAETYYRVVSEVLREHAPDILYLGSRIHGSGEPRAAYLAAAKYCDVVSMNRYQFVIAHEDLPAEAVDKPMIIGEVHFGALDRGLLHTGLRSVINQRQRGRAYVDYVRQAVENDRIVGAHWFQYTDQLVTGRGDGENYQIGFVDIVDRPYAEMIDASRRMADTLYEYRSSRR